MRPLHGAAALSIVLFAASAARAELRPVADADELLAAIASAAPGDEIVLADGTYTLSGASCAAQGTADAPIVVRAATPYGAVVELDGLEGFVVTGAHWRFEDLDVRGACAADDGLCEHAFHVVGTATDFVLRRSRVRDFHAQLKVNASPVGDGTWNIPHRGLVEYCEIGDTAPRVTDAPVTKLNIDTGDDWVVRGNYIHDFHKNGGNGISYGAFMKSGGSRGLFERNVVYCTRDVDTGGTRIGLSFGGGGTAPQFCAPAFDAGVECLLEHQDGVLRNNVIVGCSDVGIYLNRATSTRVLFNTLIETTGIDFRYETSTGEADGNVLGDVIREREGGTFTAGVNLLRQPLAFFEGIYVAPLDADFHLEGDASALLAGAPARDDVPDDLCARVRPRGTIALGAFEHSLGDCDVLPVPRGSGGSGGNGGAGGGGGAGGAGAGGGATATGTGTGAGGAPAIAGAGAGDAGSPDDEGGCDCAVPGASAPPGALLVALAAVAASRARRRRKTS